MPLKGYLLCFILVTSNPIAFTAGLTKNITMQGGTNVIFDKIITNVGNGYDKRSGNFVAPQTGTYLVHYYSMSETNKVRYFIYYTAIFITNDNRRVTT